MDDVDFTCSSDVPPEPSRRQLFSRAVALAGGALGGVLIQGAADLAQPRPARAASHHIHTRRDWRPRRPRRPTTILHRRPDHIVIHHTATPNSTDYSLHHALRLSRRIQNFHMDNLHWSDIGQHFTVSRGGHLIEGRSHTMVALWRGRHAVGAHTYGHNFHTLGIECEGNYMAARPTRAMWHALVRLCIYLCEEYDLDPHEAIVGHRNYNRTACPGSRLYAMLPHLRSRVAREMGVWMDRRNARWGLQDLGAGGDGLQDLGAGVEGPTRPFEHGPAAGPPLS